MILFWGLFYDDLFIHTKLAQKRILILCLKCMFSIQKISFILEYKFISMTLWKSWISKGVLLVIGQQQNATGITFHFPIEIILWILCISYIEYLQVHINLGALCLPGSGWHFVYTVVYINCTSCQLCKIAPQTSSLTFPGVARGQLMKNFICLLPVAGAPYEMLSTKPCWFRWQSLRTTAWSHSNQLHCWLKP